MHPFAGDLSQLKDSELETKISDLTNKYFRVPNTELKSQNAMLLDDYNQELNKRRQEQLQKLMATRDKSLDKLIKVN